MYLVWRKQKGGREYYHLISTSFYVLFHFIGYGGIALFALSFTIAQILPYGKVAKLIGTIFLLMFFVYLVLIHVGKEVVIDRKSGQVGRVCSNLLRNMYWGTPIISWCIIDRSMRVHLHRSYQPGDDEVPGMTTWKLSLRSNGEDFMLLDTDGEKFMNIMSEIAYEIALEFAIPYVDETTSSQAWINGPLFLRSNSDIDGEMKNSPKMDRDGTENVTGPSYTPEFYTFGYRMFIVIAAIFLMIGQFIQGHLVLLFILGMASMMLGVIIYNSSVIADKITIEHGRLIVSKRSRIYSRKKVAVEIFDILLIQHSAFAGRDFVEIIGTSKRFALFSNYTQPMADRMIRSLHNMISGIL